MGSCRTALKCNPVTFITQKDLNPLSFSMGRSDTGEGISMEQTPRLILQQSISVYIKSFFPSRLGLFECS